MTQLTPAGPILKLIRGSGSRHRTKLLRTGKVRDRGDQVDAVARYFRDLRLREDAGMDTRRWRQETGPQFSMLAVEFL